LSEQDDRRREEEHLKAHLPTLSASLIAITMGGFPIASASAQQAPESAALTLKARIPLANVKGRMDHLGVDLKGQRLFAAAIDNHTLEVIDLQAGRQAHTIANLNQPQGPFYDASTNRLFVASGGDGTVKIFDGSTFALVQTVQLSSDADNVRYDPHGNRVGVGYGGEKFIGGRAVRGEGDGALAFLDLTGKKTLEIRVGGHPESFQLEKSGTRVFVNVPDRKEIEVADVIKGTTLARWPVTACTDNFPMTLDEAHHRLFVGCRIPARLLVFDTESGKSIASLETGTSDDIFYDANKLRIYVISREGFIEVFQQQDADHYSKLARYPIAPASGTGFFVPDWGQLFVSARAQREQAAEILVYETK
jgi:DNA-binding beta-propeller fold protein YncE